VGVGQLLHERSQVAIVLRPENEVPMVRHQAICADAHRPRVERFLHHPLKREVVGILVEKRSATNATVQDVLAPCRPACSENLVA